MIVLFISKEMFEVEEQKPVILLLNDATYSFISMCPQQIPIMVILVTHKILGSTVIC